MSQVKLATALLRRKELAGKVALLTQIKTANIYEISTTRKSVHEGIDDVIAKVPKLTAGQVTHEHDWHARQLRLIDAAIQQANWTVDVDVPSESMGDYVAPTPAPAPAQAA